MLCFRYLTKKKIPGVRFASAYDEFLIHEIAQVNGTR